MSLNHPVCDQCFSDKLEIYREFTFCQSCRANGSIQAESRFTVKYNCAICGTPHIDKDTAERCCQHVVLTYTCRQCDEDLMDRAMLAKHNCKAAAQEATI